MPIRQPWPHSLSSVGDRGAAGGRVPLTPLNQQLRREPPQPSLGCRWRRLLSQPFEGAFLHSPHPHHTALRVTKKCGLLWGPWGFHITNSTSGCFLPTPHPTLPVICLQPRFEAEKESPYPKHWTCFPEGLLFHKLTIQG